MQDWYAWAAGLYEGEGTVNPLPSKGYSLTISMTDEDVVRRFHEVIECGHVYGPYSSGKVGKDGTPHKPCWKWVCSDVSGHRRFIERCVPYLMPRHLAQLAPVIERAKRDIRINRDSCV